MIEIQSYFNPVKSDIYANKDRWETTQIGRGIETYIDNHFPSLKFTEIAIFNIPEYKGSRNSISDYNCKIRELLYSLHFDNLPRIADLGVLKLMPERKDSFKVIEVICGDLLDNGIIPFVIGGGNDIMYAIYKAYARLDQFINLTAVDSRFDIGLEDDNLASHSHFGKIISHKPSHLFHYTHLAYHSYFVSNVATEMLESMNFEAIRLGNIKANFNEVEPIMRNTDLLCFDISAIQHTYASANLYSSPNGLDGEEACKIMRYGGISDKITAVGLFEYNQDLDVNSQTAYLLAEMIWYFIDGYKVRKNEVNPNIKNCTRYTVAFEDGKNEIVFYKSQRTSRWWMGVPFKKPDVKEFQNYYVPCSYRDYEIANKGEVPVRWLKTFNKFK